MSGKGKLHAQISREGENCRWTWRVWVDGDLYRNGFEDRDTDAISAVLEAFNSYKKKRDIPIIGTLATTTIENQRKELASLNRALNKTKKHVHELKLENSQLCTYRELYFDICRILIRRVEKYEPYVAISLVVDSVNKLLDEFEQMERDLNERC